MSKALAVLLAVLAVWVSAAPAATPRRVSLPQLARSLVKAGAPGAIVYVRTPTAMRSGAAGFADRDAHRTMRASDRYRIASVSKAFVSVVVLQLEAEAKLDIDDSVDTWLPGLVPNGAAITLRVLMNHTSGIYDFTEDPAFQNAILANPSASWSPRTLVAIGVAHAPYFAPGSNYHYSNTNYILLGLVVEAVTAKPLGQSLQERIFTPIGLTATSFPSGIELDATFVHGYVSLNGSPLFDVAPLLSPSYAWAAGAIVSNARDVTAFYRALLTGRLLLAAQLKEMKQTSGAAGTYGLGISTTFTKCGRAFGHDGDFPGWRNVVLATANGKRQTVVMVNVDQTFVSWTRMHADAERALCRG